jgi:hypothetical protein
MGALRPDRKTRQRKGSWGFRRENLPAPGAIRYSPFQQRDGAMNAPSELNVEEMLRIRLEVLRREHRDLDEAIYALETAGRPDQLTLRRLKKQKLGLKDQIARLEDKLIPDIIA